MSNIDRHAQLGIIFLIIGLGLMVAMEPWFLGVPFLILGAHRLYVGLTTKDSAEA